MQSINTNAPVRCSDTITISARSLKVWETLTNIDKWADWQKDIRSAHLNGELKPQSTFVWKSGGATIRSTLHTVEPPKKIGWTGKTLGMFAVHNWTLTENNGVTEVSVQESLEGLIARLLTSAFNKNLKKGMRNWLYLLKKESEMK